jgi:orotate phosphoribosyltransferase
MDSKYTKVESSAGYGIALRVWRGHFATAQAHVNCYLDMTDIKSRETEAQRLAKALAGHYQTSTLIDTIVCFEDTDVVGAYLAEALTHAGFQSMNLHQTIYVTHPVSSTGGQMIFLDNQKHMIAGKNVLLLMSAISTGHTADQALDCVRYYGGQIAGICSIFSGVKSIENIPIAAAFTEADLPGYGVYKPNECPYCHAGTKIDGMVVPQGFIKL